MRYVLLLVCVMVTGCQVPSGPGNAFFQSSNQEGVVSARSVSFYNSFTAAESQGATESGRIPVWVPRSARNLNETHSVDTVQSLLAFEFDPGDREMLTPTCQRVSANDIQFPALQADWWPPDLRDAAGAIASGFAIYDCTNEMGYLAIDESGGQAYFWIP